MSASHASLARAPRFPPARPTVALLRAVRDGDAEAFAELCDQENEMADGDAAARERVGAAFAAEGACGALAVMRAPASVRLLGTTAVVSYARGAEEAGAPACDETRVWQLQGGRWRCVHAHRSAAKS